MAGNLRGWIKEHRAKIRASPLRGLLHAVFTAYLGFWYTLTSRWPFGTHVYDEDWDLLVILDACRVDVLDDVADEYAFIETVDSRWSIGSHSHEWLTQTFSRAHEAEIAETAYISGNGHTYETFTEREYPPDETVPVCRPNWNGVDERDFGHLDMLWETAHTDGIGVPPRAITDRTVEVARESEYDRTVAHYMQPHIPYISQAVAEDRQPTELESRGWKHLESGTADRSEIWELYEDNLRLVLDEVELLLENVDAETVVVTADHGNAFGEYTITGHPEGMLLPSVRRVPWVTTTATDTGTFDPDGDYGTASEDTTDINDHLEDLGYL
ncbi:conserved hypothetical protein [Halobacterium salinarum NRC-1]|uniref:AlkP-core domain protein n=3 Tax=Halobacterium salinarum TaxID=2242 RepID=Q9HQQ3_HALSA|nr:hypothetical protein [Halobacterium salinarum]AAG19460.1 conserved hypothetical protein [Halobacterium salinarum NRC-1]MBB6090144.1 hypothetical protein [Halobacterium salinarum]UEB92884.1 hypothetical protein LJ422_04320 [Halobacterium salinarum NRC-34001]CAP13736.1 AlkP-core domain protein [Halobacterium salinarum R1]DAC78173.1 TPA_inf: AlkP-core domain protein [Halobacterium salinarum NRC-1]